MLVNIQHFKSGVNLLIGIGSVQEKQLGRSGEAQQRRAEQGRLAQIIYTVHVHT